MNNCHIFKIASAFIVIVSTFLVFADSTYGQVQPRPNVRSPVLIPNIPLRIRPPVFNPSPDTSISYHFMGTSVGPQTVGFNSAGIEDTIEGTFTFDKSLFAGVGAFRNPSNSADFYEQESPDASIAFELIRTTGVLMVGSESEIRTTARPDLRYVDSDADASGVSFNYDNLENRWGGFFKLRFRSIAILDDELDLLNASGTAFYRNKYQMGGNTFSLYNITVDELVGAQSGAEPRADETSVTVR